MAWILIKIRGIRFWGEKLVRAEAMRNRTHRKGTVLVEFALVLPLFLLLLLGIMEFASVFFVRHAILSAASEASRSYAIGESTSAQAEQIALTQLAGINADFSATSSSESDTGLERWVEVSVSMNQASLGDPLNLLGSSPLTVRVTMRREEE
jgi:Flp pilus assembly protein TadG